MAGTADAVEVATAAAANAEVIKDSDKKLWPCT